MLGYNGIFEGYKALAARVIDEACADWVNIGIGQRLVASAERGLNRDDPYWDDFEVSHEEILAFYESNAFDMWVSCLDGDIDIEVLRRMCIRQLQAGELEQEVELVASYK